MGARVGKPLNPEDRSEYRTQLEIPVQLITSATVQRYAQQVTRQPGSKRVHLYLGANEVFFDGTQHVKAVQSTETINGIAEPEWNQDKHFRHIGDLGRSLKDGLFWSIYIPRRTNLVAHFRMDFQVACELRMTVDAELGKNAQVRSRQFTAIPDTGKYSARVPLRQMTPGFHTIRVQVVNTTKPGHPVGTFHYIKLSCRRPLSIVRERWRPVATHMKFQSTHAMKAKLKNTTQFVMAIDPLPSLPSFSPISTRFGYYGPVLNEHGQAIGVNFSLWSFGAAANPVPPQHQWSRLLAVGSPSMTFSEFSHEGTGVKPRAEAALLRDLKPPYVMALQCDSNPLHQPNSEGVSTRVGFLTTYISHYWNGSDWKLFAVGQKFTTRRVNDITPNAFIEVPGVAERQRTNHVTRVVQYQGFVSGPPEPPAPPISPSTSEEHLVDTDDFVHDSSVPAGWYPLDQIVEPRGEGYTNKRWGATDDMLWASCGGLDQKRSASSRVAHTSNAYNGNYPYMAQIHQIHTALPYPVIVSADRHQDKQTQVELMVRLVPDVDSTQRCTLYYGETDGLTIARLWDVRTSRKSVKELVVQWTVPSVRYYRVMVERSDGKYWCTETYDANAPQTD